ncbi:MAG: DUF2892 domain-containing protein, partial [Bacteroidota bacterium]
RNIGWQDRMIRTIVGVLAIIEAIYFFKTNLLYTILLGVFAIAQFGTVLSAKCILCYFAGQCTIGASERKKLDHQGIKYDFSK